MPIQAQDGGSGITSPASLTKFVRDVIQREPPRPVAAQSFGTVTAADAVHTPALVVGGVTQPKITTQSLSLGPPPNPADGDIWVARDVDGNGTRWMFQYNAGSSSAYKWEFVGGSPINLTANGLGGYTLNTWTAFVSYTAARSGEYLASGGWAGTNSGGGAATQRLGVGVGGAAPARYAGAGIANANYDFNISVMPWNYTVTTGNALSLMYWVNASPSGFEGAGMFVQPRRIS